MKNFKEIIVVLGGGPFATALAYVLTRNNYKVVWYMRNEEVIRSLKQKGVNSKYLSEIRFDKALISPTSNLQSAISQSEYIVVAVPSAYLYDSIMSAVPGTAWKDKKVISAVKGFVTNGNRLLNDYLHVMHDFPMENYVSLMGPCHAEEVAKGNLSYLTFSGLDKKLRKKVARMFKNTNIQTRDNNDLWGAQFAAILKNIYAIGAGIARGLGYGDNFMSVYITNCNTEMVKFLKDHFDLMHPSSEIPNFDGSCYLGDLLVTAYSVFSRNRRYGDHIGKGLSPKDASDEMEDSFPEGYYGSQAMKKIFDEHNLKIPIASYMYHILHNDVAPEMVFKKLKKLFI